MRQPRRPAPLLLRGGRTWSPLDLAERDLACARGQVVEAAPEGARSVDLSGRLVLPGLVNAHDHFDLALFPPLGRPPYANGYDWAAAIDPADPALVAALRVPLVERLVLGGLRNLLAGVTAAVHHGADHRTLDRDDFPVHVQRRYSFALSPGQTPALRKTYRTTDRRVPWFVHAGEGTDARVSGELDALATANVLRQNTVIARGVAFGGEDARRMAAAHADLVWCPEADRRQYAATTDVRTMRAAGVRVGLGSESPATGARDLLSTLAAARHEQVLSDVDLLLLATKESAQVARMPVGGFEAGAPADFLVVDEIEGLLRGERNAIALMVVGGRPLYGDVALMEAAGVPCSRVIVDGAERGLRTDLASPLRAGVRAVVKGRAPGWMVGLEV
jgi:cytosine/adenosine deaminase-related metal-dependent hydrolase